MKGGCGIEEKNVERDESQVAEDGREGVEDHGWGHLRWRCSCFDGASLDPEVADYPLDAEVADYDLVAEQECLGCED